VSRARDGTAKRGKATPAGSLPAFVAAAVDRLAPLGEIRVRAMFGGWTLYADGVVFALIDGDRLFFKVDDGNRDDYRQAGMAAFRPFPDKPMTMSYWEVPAAVRDDPDQLLAWAGAARAAQLRARAAKPARGPGNGMARRGR